MLSVFRVSERERESLPYCLRVSNTHMKGHIFVYSDSLRSDKIHLPRLSVCCERARAGARYLF